MSLLSLHSIVVTHDFVTELARNPPDGVSVGLGEDESIFNWEILLVGPPETLYEGGFFNATLTFPQDFPNMPPKMVFKTPIWHPNGKSHCVYICVLNVSVHTHILIIAATIHPCLLKVCTLYSPLCVDVSF
ncbi:hypothetical protein EON63_24485 [archaeon]|nr:MAG: hypothetical protein EON63_24485 [archaeon]